ncbi:MAG: transposase [Candidatus Thiodiazotropha taylori]|nr:transposase [Candidatus Thiodiazotropha taylori]
MNNVMQIFTHSYFNYSINAVPATLHGMVFVSSMSFFSLDGSLLNASMKLFPWADYNRKKAALKLHVGLDQNGLIHCFARIIEGRVSENEQARAIDVPKGSVVVSEKGYNNYRWHNAQKDKGIHWVTRIRGNPKHRVLERRNTAHSPAVTSDQIIKYSSKQRDGDKLYPITRIGYRDLDTGRHNVFITNHFDWSAQTIADIYK